MTKTRFILALVLSLTSFVAFADEVKSSNVANIEISYTKSQGAVLGKSLKIEIFHPNEEKLLKTCYAKLADNKFVCSLENLPKGDYKLKFINDIHSPVWTGNAGNFTTAQIVNLQNEFSFMHKVLTTGKELKNLVKQKRITAKDIHIPEQKKPLTKREVENFIATINAKTDYYNKICLPASAFSNGKLKGLKHEGYLNILGVEFLKIRKNKLVVEMNSIKIGKMPFSGYAEVNVPFKNIYTDKLGNIYIDYLAPKKLKETNYIKVMGSKAAILHFVLKFVLASGEFEVFVYSKDKVMFAGEREVEFFAKGKGL